MRGALSVMHWLPASPPLIASKFSGDRLRPFCRGTWIPPQRLYLPQRSPGWQAWRSVPPRTSYVSDLPAHGPENGEASFKDLPVASDHDGECSVFRFFLPAAHWCISMDTPFSASFSAASFADADRWSSYRYTPGRNGRLRICPLSRRQLL